MSGHVSNKSTVLEHLDKFTNAGIVEKVELPEDQRERDLPRTFYRITEDGLAFLQDHGLLRNTEALRQIYEATEKPDKIERFESGPRPDSITDGNSQDGDTDEIMAVLEEYKQTGDPEEAAKKIRDLQQQNSADASGSIRAFLGCQFQRFKSALIRAEQEVREVCSPVESKILQMTRHR